ncbi:MAG: stalk domain-containing protein, partial [Mucilaginibacter sp.]
TECAGDSDESEVAYFKKNWRTRQAFVHTFVDIDSITQTAKWEFKAWGCGNGNARFISIEMCSASSQDEFKQIYDRTCWLAASKLFERKLGVVDGVTLVSHDWVHRNLGGTTHSDPIAYLKQWGKTWDDMVKDIQHVYNTLSQPIIQTQSTEKKIDVAVNEKVISHDGFIVDGRSYAPIRVIAEGLGCEVGWDGTKGKASISGVDIDSTLNKNGVTYAWSAEVAKASGALIEWDSKTQTVYYHK